jgi:hypothetical protein
MFITLIWCTAVAAVVNVAIAVATGVLRHEAFAITVVTADT